MPEVNDAFKVVHYVEPQSAVAYVPSAKDYNDGLLALQPAIAKAAADPSALKAAQDAADEATGTTKKYYSSFPPDRDGQGTVVFNLLMEPITEANRKLKPSPDPINSAGAGFCNSFGPITRRYPFNPSAGDEVTLAELAAIFGPTSGKISDLAKGVKDVIQCTGGECTAVDKSPFVVNPAFLRFLNIAMKFSHALYGDSGTSPNYHYTLTPLKSVQVDSFDITVNGDRSTLAGGTKKEFIWPGGANPNFKLNLTLSGGSPLGVQSFDGLWSVFRFFARANTKGVKGSSYDFQWTVTSGDPPTPVISPVNDQPLTYEITFDANGAPAIFSKEFLAGMKCVPTVAK
jgi:hypothetical protein